MVGVVALALALALTTHAQIYTNPDFGRDQAQNVRDANNANMGTTTGLPNTGENTTGTNGTGLPDTGTRSTTTGTTTPGLPSTGAGGDLPANIALVVAAAIVAFGGGMILLKRAS